MMSFKPGDKVVAIVDGDYPDVSRDLPGIVRSVKNELITVDFEPLFYIAEGIEESALNAITRVMFDYEIRKINE